MWNNQIANTDAQKLESVVQESTRLYDVEGVNESNLLDQNIKSYHDMSEATMFITPYLTITYMETSKEAPKYQKVL